MEALAVPFLFIVIIILIIMRPAPQGPITAYPGAIVQVQTNNAPTTVIRL
jgi:hypothetical protein